MATTTMVAASLRRLLADVAADRDAITKLATEAAQTAMSAGSASTRQQLALLALDLHGYYTGAESIFERIARTIDQFLPSGSESHKELLDAMTRPLEEVRPAVVSADLGSDLHKLLAFRHFFRHAYAVELDAGEMLAHAARLGRVHPRLVQDIDRFTDFVRGMIASLERG